MSAIAEQVVIEVKRASVNTKVGTIKIKSRGQKIVIPDLFTALEAAFKELSTFRIVLTKRLNLRIQYNLK
jgi:hypothetical protein